MLSFKRCTLITLLSLLFILVSCSTKKTNLENTTETQVETTTTAQSDNMNNALSETDKEIIDTVIDNFMPLTQVPRPSHHEEKISEYLYNWAKDAGFNPEKDKVNNIMFNVPATSGMEDKPLGILQGHMPFS